MNQNKIFETMDGKKSVLEIKKILVEDWNSKHKSEKINAPIYFCNNCNKKRKFIEVVSYSKITGKKHPADQEPVFKFCVICEIIQ